MILLTVVYSFDSGFMILMLAFKSFKCRDIWGVTFFHLTHLFPSNHSLLPENTKQNLTVFRCFHGVKKGCIGNEKVEVLTKYFAPILSVIPAGINLLKVSNRNTGTRCEICSKLTNSKDTRTMPLLASFWCLYS